MDLRDITKNQHFIPQVEQRFNAINPQAKSENQKIYSFSIRDRNSYIIAIDSKKGSNISKNLQILHLFSFDVLKEEAGRYNFEKLFYDYETRVKVNTESLLSKLCIPHADIKSEILNIFSSKILNFVRNPYSIKKILNTFSNFKGMTPNDPIHFGNFERVLNGIKPQQDYLCEQLDVTKDNYKDWLAIIFFLLNSMREDQTNFLDQVIKRVYENPSLFIQVDVYTYDDEICLLSDRGFNMYELEENTTVWEFNLCSHAFLRYVFVDIDKFLLEDTLKEVTDRVKLESNTVRVSLNCNDLAALGRYNQRTVELCHEQVFSSNKSCYGVKVI